MASFLSEEEIKNLKKTIKGSKLDKDSVAFDDVAFNELVEAIKEAPLIDAMTPVNQMALNQILEEADGTHYMHLNDEKFIIEEKYYPIVQFTASYAPQEIIDNKNFVENIISKIEALVEWIFQTKNKGRKIKTDLVALVENIDSVYLDIRKRIIAIEDQYDSELIEYLLLLPDLLVYLIKFAASNKVPMAMKFKLLLTIYYIVSPIDVIPEGILGPLGYIDDTYLALKYIVDNIFTSDLSRELIVELWPGKLSAINNLTDTYTHLMKFLGSPLTNLIEKAFGKLASNKK
jgi:uncharacterized membrane protein YkvA (DUF1232 family)